MTTSRTPRSPKTSANSSDPTIIISSSEYLDEDLLNEALIIDIQVEPIKTKTITREQLKNLVEKISDTYRIPFGLAYTGLCCTLQAGGSNKNKRSNIKITLNGNAFESKKINEIIQQQLQMTPRQLARQIAREIFAVSKKNNIMGNAYISLKRFYPHLLTEVPDERYWAADFQIDNSSCPEYIRNALRQRYSDKFTTPPQKRGNG